VSLSRFVDAADPRERTLLLVNWEAPRPLRSMLEGMFADQPIRVDESEVADEERDVVYLVEEGEVVAASPLDALKESILLVNSDTYMTGSGGLDDLTVPDVVDALADARFRLRGYPESNDEKLLLIVISRYIERLGLDREGGRHRASFQRLSRIDDERGTRCVYERLADSGTDTHVYGMPDWTPPPEVDLTMHGGWSADFRDVWFVVSVPEDDDGRHAALVAVEREPRRWDGFWTYDPERVTEINDHIARRL
jgi:hypothetical protein